MDEEVLAEIITNAVSTQLNENGIRQQKNLWVRLAIQIVVAAVGITVGYFIFVHGPIEANTDDIVLLNRALTVECERSKKVDETLTGGVTTINLKMTAIKTKQDAVMIEQKSQGEDIKEVLKRLPK